MQATIGRWGRSLAVRLPAEIAAETGLAEGQKVDVVAVGHEVLIRSAAPRINVEDLFKGRSTEQWRALYAGSYDWGPDQGREVIDE